MTALDTVTGNGGTGVMGDGGPVYLRVERGPAVGERLPVAGEGATIGRLAGNTIVLADERLSRRHTRFDLGPGGLTVTDLGSANGTRQSLAYGCNAAKC